MNEGEIRIAIFADATGIFKTIGLVWPDSAVSIERVEQVLNNRSHVTTVSMSGGEVVGFADGFITTSEDGTKRWELDLLAVQPDFQRRGIAATLVATNTHAGQLRGAEMARGLVAVDNVASQRSFARCGYATDEVICELLIAFKSTSKDVVEPNRKSALIQVNTLNYSGLWIEGERMRNRLESALDELANSQNDLVGMVVPIQEKQVVETAFSLGFESVGRYQWWQRPLVNG